MHMSRRASSNHNADLKQTEKALDDSVIDAGIHQSILTQVETFSKRTMNGFRIGSVIERVYVIV
jgi:hypothetical protein